MLFRRRRPPATWPSQGIAFRIGQGLGQLGHYMAGWSRMTRATIVIVGMALAIALFWLGLMGWGVGVGLTALALFWLTLPSDVADVGAELEPEPMQEQPDPDAEEGAPGANVVHGDLRVDRMTFNVGRRAGRTPPPKD